MKRAASGRVQMIDVSEKKPTVRTAVASGFETPCCAWLLTMRIWV